MTFPDPSGVLSGFPLKGASKINPINTGQVLATGLASTLSSDPDQISEASIFSTYYRRHSLGPATITVRYYINQVRSLECHLGYKRVDQLG